jgi:hypothetical protein
VFGDVAVGLGVGEPEPGPAQDVQIGVDFGAVHPEEQTGFVDAVALAGVRIGRRQHAVDLADSGTRPLGGLGGAVRRRADEVRGAHQASPGVTPEVGVLHDAAYRAGVQGLEVERPDAGDPHHGVAVRLPGHRTGSEQPGVRAGHATHLRPAPTMTQFEQSVDAAGFAASPCRSPPCRPIVEI